jgi:hypothetical protein
VSWRAPFVAALSARAAAPVYVLEVVTVYQEPGRAWSCASVPGIGSSAIGIGAPRGGQRVRVEGGRLTPRAWTSTIGAWSVGLVGDLSALAGYVTRGTVVQLKAGFAGMAPDDFEAIAIGQVKNIRGKAPYFTLECHDIMTALRQRITTDYASAILFSNVGATTTVALAWTASATMTVVSTTGFERRTGASGAVFVTPLTGDPFILTYTGTTATSFTGCSTTGQLGTVASTAGIGATVAELLYLDGHPLDIARRVLCSQSGTAANGLYDALPSGSGLGLLNALVDHDDIDRYKGDVVTVSSGSYLWELAVSAEAEDAYAWLTSLLAPAGLFLASRQGLLTVRAAQDTRSATYVSDLDVTDEDIATVLSYEAYDYTHSPEYARAYAVTGTGGLTSTSATLATLPARGSLTYDVADRVWSNEAAIQADMVGRLHESAARVPERLEVRCASRRLAQLAVGDVVDLTSRRTHSRRDGALGWSSRRALVDGVSPDWDAGVVDVGLVVYPETEDIGA